MEYYGVSIYLLVDIKPNIATRKGILPKTSPLHFSAKSIPIPFRVTW